MSISSERKPEESETAPVQPSSIALIMKDIGDTTWRMFVPTIGLLALGYYGDKSFDTTPWLSLAGIICGAAITALLIKQQLQKVKQK